MEDAYAASIPNLSHAQMSAPERSNMVEIPLLGKEMSASSRATEAAEEELWATVLDEFEGPLRRKGLWSKLYAELAGDEVKIRVAYLKTRFAQMRQELAEANQVAERHRWQSLSARDCYAKRLYVEFKAEGYECLHFHNGQAAIRFRDKIKVYASPDAVRHRVAELALPEPLNPTPSIDEFSH